MDFLDNLNPEQREAVLQSDGPLLILAGAGSGKTRVIAYRIAYLIGAGLAEPPEVLAVTFTNKAADEMRTRGDMADRRPRRVDLDVHRCGGVRREAPAIGLSRDFVIYDASDQLTAMKHPARTASTTA
jgi:DNA helicase-2/ATP-dependent DNA helicase PcrA